MRKYFLLLFSICLFILQSCKSNLKDLKKVELKRDVAINQFSDSTFFSDIRSLYFYQGNYYVSDYNRDQIVILNSELELIKTLGGKGKGPGELLGASHIYVDNDTIFIYNDHKKTFELYNFNKHLQSINLLNQIQVNSDVRFLVSNDIYFSSFHSPFSIAKYNYKIDSTVFFGNSMEYRTPKERRIKNNRHIHICNDNIIAIPDCQAIIEIYDLKGKFINEFNLSDIAPINEILNYIRKQDNPENSYFKFFSDSYVYNNMIFIMLLTVDENNKRFSNQILQVELNNGIMKPIKILDLGEGWFGPIVVTKDKILTFNSLTSELVQFDY